MIYPKIDYNHTTRSVANFNFFLRWGCEIWYLISGDVRYFVENQIYEVEPGDIIITNPSEIHKPTFKSDKTYERITVCLDPTFFSQFSTEAFDLLSCFYDRKNGEGNKITLSEEENAEVRRIFSEIEREYASSETSSEVRINALMLELLVLLNKAARGSDKREQVDLGGLVREIISYVERNLDGELSLSALERAFFLSAEHLCRSFKNETGITLHGFIVKKRMATAQLLLASGESVTETAERCGFSDLSNFIRSFKKHVGMTPSEYKKTARPFVVKRLVR